MRDILIKMSNLMYSSMFFFLFLLFALLQLQRWNYVHDLRAQFLSMFRVQTEANRSDDCQWTKETNPREPSKG